MRNSHTHVVYAFIPGATEPLAMGFGKSNKRAVADATRLVTEIRARPHDSLVIDGPIDLYAIRSADARRVFVLRIPATGGAL